jgi:hypothetical protein
MSAFDAAAVAPALRDARAEVVIDELTSLPKDFRDGRCGTGQSEAADRERRESPSRRDRVRVRRFIQQVSGFFHEPGSGLADEGLAVTPARVWPYARTYAELEARVLECGVDGRHRPAAPLSEHS